MSDIEEEPNTTTGGPDALQPEVRRAMRFITIAGCLAMVFMHLMKGAPRAAFLRDIGARPFHFGVIGAIPPLMFAFQFVAALVINRFRRRKRIWIALLVTRRAMVCLLGLLPWLLPDASATALVWSFIGIMAIGSIMEKFAQPMFFAWMGDLIPSDIFTEVWAGRRKWLSWTHATLMVTLAAALWVFRDADIRIVFPVLACISAVAGVVDILLFVNVPEPPPSLSPEPHLARLAEPFRYKRFRRYMLYDSVLKFGAMIGAPLFRIFLLQEIGLGVHEIVLLFTCHALGGALFARRIGRLADDVGHRPVIILASALKCVIVLAMFVLVPGPMVLILVPVLLMDNMLNTALVTSRTGFTLKRAPAENRPMFVAAVLATAGLAGAAGSLFGGLLMDHLPDLDWRVGAWALTRFRMVFALSAVIRFCGFLMSIRLHEPESSEATEVFRDIIAPAFQRQLELPIGIIKNIRNILSTDPGSGNDEPTSKGDSNDK